ncbi:NAD-dependent succinate-semialdehyde dehydrogenase [Salsipaludibacter albus]|uniref:NAD-dependent succinate-semialdehyde dehydrogenase n=1 Tax=Salsipaludibacter albus TaxID=2849650 RepID=UPI001EE3CC31|nr:NAD-dependent succinate-semialdehyde dehydrogenase [Salsipaludibacter albus]MBY5161267.1 NAD-dependent succinate-semialdehyde dehydrogenase [Salsipaludibacter albus]
MLTTINPTTGQQVATWETHDADQVTTALARSWDAFGDWRSAGLARRTEVLAAAADELDRRRDELAELMVTEMGKTLAAAGSEVDKCAWACRHYAEHAAGYLAHDVIETDAARSYVRFDPLGPILAIMPWNFPFWQAFRALAPALAAGNTMLLKHASNVPGCAMAIEEVLTAAGAPDGVFTTLLIGSDPIDDIIADQRIRGVTLTGSEPAGRAVAEQAGAHLTPTVLELGGSDPFIVLPDADIDHAAEVAASSRLINNGQSCIAAKRFIVVGDALEPFTEAFRAQLAEATVGDPMEDDTDVGPLAREDLRDDLQDQVRRSVDDGARLVLGGEVQDRPGWFHDVTLLTDVDMRHAAGWEETFGPLAAVLPAADEQDAVALANASRFGLGAAIFSTDVEHAQEVAAQVESGAVFVNELVKSDPRVPFGGVKDSGYGRELGEYGAKAFTNAKTIWVS